MTPGAEARWRPVLTWTRWTFYLGSLLATVAALQLFVGSEATDEYFSWTIQPFLTAAFLGACYFTALVFFLTSLRERLWAHVRVCVIASVVFGPMIVVAQHVHFDKFHTDAESLLTRAGTWAFIATYWFFSLAFIAVLVLQERMRAADPPRAAPLAGWVRTLLTAQAAVLLVVAALLLVAPADTARIWPWPLTELTGRAVGAWCAAIGAAAAAGVWENDWRRLRGPFAAFVTLPVLEAVAIARYTDTVDWGHPGSFVIVVVLASMLAIGVVGLRGARRVPAPDAERRDRAPELRQAALSSAGEHDDRPRA